MITTCRRTGCGNEGRTADPEIPACCSLQCQAAVLAKRTIADLDPAHSDSGTVRTELQAAIAAAGDPAKTAVIETDIHVLAKAASISIRDLHRDVVVAEVLQLDAEAEPRPSVLDQMRAQLREVREGFEIVEVPEPRRSIVVRVARRVGLGRWFG